MQRALQFFDEIMASHISSDSHTFFGLLKASSKLGDVEWLIILFQK